MKVVFLEDVPGTARIGEIKEVKPGFARNYLLPRRIAMPATPAVVKSAEARATREAKLQDARDNDARAVAARVEASPVTVSARAGSTGKLFGSVGTADLATKVAEITGQEFDRHNVLLPEPIKELGDFDVKVRLTRNVTASLRVSVVGEDGTTAADIHKRGTSEEAETPSAESSAPATDESEGSDEYAAEVAGEKDDDE